MKLIISWREFDIKVQSYFIRKLSYPPQSVFTVRFIIKVLFLIFLLGRIYFVFSFNRKIRFHHLFTFLKFKIFYFSKINMFVIYPFNIFPFARTKSILNSSKSLSSQNNLEILGHPVCAANIPLNFLIEISDSDIGILTAELNLVSLNSVIIVNIY